MTTIASEHFKQALLAVLDEVFDNVHGFFLDQGTSFFETLATISAEQASVPVGGRCATLAAQVEHVAFYLDVVVRMIRYGEYLRVDWGEIWRTVGAVTPAEWEAIQNRLRASYTNVQELIHATTEWPTEREVGGAIGLIAHTAYHLGEVRQALCTLQAN